MQYFDKTWFSGKLSEKEMNSRKSIYGKHIMFLKKNTNFLIRILFDFNFHDSIIITKNDDFLLFYIGDNQNGYYSVRCQFNNLERQNDFYVPLYIMAAEFYKNNLKYSFHILDEKLEEYILEFTDVTILEIEKIDSSEYFKFLK